MRHPPTHRERAGRRAAPSRPAISSWAEPAQKQSGGLSGPGEELGLLAQHRLQGRLTYSSAEERT
jgi:hypothetical protein